MIRAAENRLYMICPACQAGDWRVDHLVTGFKTRWSCHECHVYFDIERTGPNSFDFTQVVGAEGIETPETVTLVSCTNPPITLKLNTWKYGHSQKYSVAEHRENQRYFYDQHTCPTNWVSQIEAIIFEGDDDPHGVFKFVSVEDGHYVDPNVVG